MYSLHQREPGTCPSLFQSLASGYISKERGNFGLIPKLNLDYSSQKIFSSLSLGSFLSFLPQLWMPGASFSLLPFLLTKHSQPLACWLRPLGCFPASATPCSVPANLCREDFSLGHPLPRASTTRLVIAEAVATSSTAVHPARRVKASPQTA